MSSARDEMAEAIAAEVAELLRHLPADEIGDDEPIAFAVNTDNTFGGITARGALYRMTHGVAARYSRVGDREELVAWRDGVMLDAREVRGWSN